MLIQQAVFTSVRSGRSAGYRLVANSGTLAPEDRRELTIWGPSHDSLLVDDPGASSVNFHPLPSGAFCISKTAGAGAEYSARGGQQIYTQCLVVPADVLARFGNNPFAVLTAVRARGAIEVHETVPDRLEPIQLTGRASAVDRRLIEKLHNSQAADWVAAAVQVALSAETFALAVSSQPETVLAAVLNCLPPQWRTAFSFTTGLKYSPRRPFRVFALVGDSAAQRRVLRQTGATVCDLDDPPPLDNADADGWPQFIRAVIQSGQVSRLAEHLSHVPEECTLDELHQLGRRLLDELCADEGHTPGAAVMDRAPLDNDATKNSGGLETATPPLVGSEQMSDLPATAMGQTAVGPVQQGSAATVVASGVYPRLADNVCHEPAPWQGIANPAALETLERLDDAVFDAITGRAFSLANISALWSNVRRHVDKPLLEESREKYVQHALRIWKSCVDGDDVHDPTTAVRAVEIISVLFDS